MAISPLFAKLHLRDSKHAMSKAGKKKAAKTKK